MPEFPNDFINHNKKNIPGTDHEQTIDDLLQTYKNIDDIPEEELKSIGYERYAPGRVRSIEFKEQDKAKKEAFERRFAEKIKNAPFKEIELSLPPGRFSGKRLSQDTVERFKQKMEKLTTFEENISTLGIYEHNLKESLPPKNSVLNLASGFADFIDKIEFFPPEEKEELKELIFFDAFTPGIIGNRMNELLEELDDLWHNRRQENEDFISSKESFAIGQQLELTKGKYTDINLLREHYQESMSNSAQSETKDLPELNRYFKKNKLKTVENVVMHFLVENYLEKEKGMEGISRAMQNTKDSSELSSSLDSYKKERMMKLFEEEKKLHAELKNYSPEEKDALGQKIEEIRQLKQEETKLIEGLKEYFSAPELAAQFFYKTTKELQDFFLYKKDVEGEAEIIMDGLPDLNYDKNPGGKVKDCTDGCPLPFMEPDIPIYNVKVFLKKEKTKEHLGSVYLLVTETGPQENKQKVWHLDAIQIPSLEIDWSAETIERIIIRLAEEAIKKEVGMITVNSIGKSEKISNSDFIREAVLDYYKSINTDNEEIIINTFYEKFRAIDEDEKISNKYSDLQSDGPATPLWKKEKL